MPTASVIGASVSFLNVMGEWLLHAEATMLILTSMTIAITIFNMNVSMCAKAAEEWV